MEPHLSIYPRSEDVEIPSKEEVENEMDAVIEEATAELVKRHEELQLLREEEDDNWHELLEIAKTKGIKIEQLLLMPHTLVAKRTHIQNAIRTLIGLIRDLNEAFPQPDTVHMLNADELAIIQESLSKAISQESLAVVDALTGSTPTEPQSQVILPFPGKEEQ